MKYLNKFNRPQHTIKRDHDILSHLSQIRETQREANAESEFSACWEAFGMRHPFHGNWESPWGTFYGPRQFNDETGSINESPKKEELPELISIWARLAGESKSPVLLARFSDLVWDLSKLANLKQEIKFAQQTIDAYILIADHRLYTRSESLLFAKLSRALNLALSINDKQRLNSVVAAFISLEDSIEDDEKTGLWGHCFDLLLENKKIRLSAEQENQIIQKLQTRLANVSNLARGPKVDPWAAKDSAERLAQYYIKRNSRKDAIEVLNKMIQTYEAHSQHHSSKLQAAAGLERCQELLYQFGFIQEARGLGSRVRELQMESLSEFGVISAPIEIDQNELNQWLDALVTDDLRLSILNLFNHCLPRRQDVEKHIVELAQDSPIHLMLPKGLVDFKGIPKSITGNFQDDPDGFIISKVSDTLVAMIPYLRYALDRLFSKHALDTEGLVEFFLENMAFHPDHAPFLQSGIELYDFPPDNNIIFPDSLLV